MANVDEMVVKWSMDSTNFNDGLTKINRSMKMVQSEFNATDSKLKNFGNTTDQLKNKQKYLSDTLELQKKKVESLRDSYEKAKEKTGANSKETENLSIKLNNAVSYYNKLQGELNTTNSELEKQGNKWYQLGQKIEGISNKLNTVGKKLSDFGKSMTTFVTVPLIGAGAASFEMASDLDESTNKVDVAFGSCADSIKKWSDSTLESYGIAKGTALDMASTYGDMATSMGLTDDEASNMAQSLVGLAGDLSSFKNISIDVANTALNSIFTGETESLKQLGIVMTQTNLNEFAMQQGMDKTIDKMSQSEQVQLRYAYVMAMTQNAQGDFARTSDGAANQQRIFTESLKELAATLGSTLLPIFTPIITKVNEWLQKFKSLSPETQNLIVKIGLIVAAVGPLITIVGKAMTLVKTVINIGKILKTVITTINAVLAANPIFLIIAAITGIIAGLVLLYKKCEWFRDGVNAIWEAIKNAFSSVWEFIKSIFMRAIENFKIQTEIIKTVWNTVCNSIKSVWDWICNGITSAINGIKSIWNGVCNFFGSAWNAVCNGIGSVFTGIKNTVVGIAQGMVNTVIRAINWCIGALNKISFDVPDWVPAIGGKTFGFNISKISEVNWLYKGGIIENPTILGGGIGVGDSYKGIGSNAEAVIPLDSMYANLRNIVRDENNSNQPIYVIVNVDNNMDSKAIGKAVTTQVKKEITRDTRNYSRAKGGLGIV